MKFCELLMNYRGKHKLTKTELANAINVDPTYIMNIEKGIQRPPTIDRCKEIARALRLSPAESKSLIDAAAYERMSPEMLEWITTKERDVAKVHCNCDIAPEVLDALSDPVAVSALLATHKSTKDIKQAIRHCIEHLPDLSPDKRKALILLCQ